MGLDILACKNATLLNATEDEDGRAIDNSIGLEIDGYYIKIYINPHFSGRADEFIDGGVYGFEDSFDAGFGYSSHFQFREYLAKLAGYPKATYEGHGVKEEKHISGAWNADSGPFWELINFSDCEGTLGTAVSKKLLADFVAYQDKIECMGDRFASTYNSWKTAFEYASENGFVSFG
ncbi:hypothetical protein ACP3S7_19285 [Phytobacter ursingii]